MGVGLSAFVGAKLKPGVEVVLDLVGIDKELANADLVITGEGRLDSQTAFGKDPAGVGMRAKKYGVPCLAIAGGICGSITDLHTLGIDACFSLCTGPMSLDEAIHNAPELLAAIAEQALRAFVAGGKPR